MSPLGALLDLLFRVGIRLESPITRLLGSGCVSLFESRKFLNRLDCLAMKAETNIVSACYALAKVSSKLYGLHPGTRIAAQTADAEMT